MEKNNIHKRFTTWSEPLFDAIKACEDFVEMKSEGSGMKKVRVFEIHRKRKIIKVGLNGLTLSVKDVGTEKPTIVYSGYSIHDKLLNKFLNT